MGLKIKDVKSLNTGEQVDNTYFEKILDTSDEWIRTRTGIKSRYFTEELPSEMAAELGKLLEFDRDQVKMIIVTSFSNDLIMPSIAGKVHKELDLPSGCFSMDLNAACAGFVASMVLDEKYLEEGQEALLIASEKISSCLDFTDRGTVILFGDGCAGMVVKKNSKLWVSDESTYGDEDSLLLKKGEFIKMRGQEVFRFACSKVPESIEKVITKSGLPLEDIDYVVAHQANVRILDQVAKRTGIAGDKFLKNIEDHGNTSAASVPTLVSDYKDRFKDGDKVVFSAFGAGLVVNSILMEW